MSSSTLRAHVECTHLVCPSLGTTPSTYAFNGHGTEAKGLPRDRSLGHKFSLPVFD